MSKATPNWVPKNEQPAKQPDAPPVVDQQPPAPNESQVPAEFALQPTEPETKDSETEGTFDVNEALAHTRKVFTEPPKPKSVFNREKPVATKEQEPEIVEVPEGTPSWGEFANFICKFGDMISRAEYPNPKGEVVETIWQGVPIKNGPAARIMHKREGWVAWADCQ